MTESEVHANPAKIESLAEDLKQFVTALRSETESINGEFKRLGSTWRDGEYEKFQRSFSRLNESIESLTEELTKREPQLKEDAQALLHYLNHEQ